MSESHTTPLKHPIFIYSYTTTSLPHSWNHPNVHIHSIIHSLAYIHTLNHSLTHSRGYIHTYIHTHTYTHIQRSALQALAHFFMRYPENSGEMIYTLDSVILLDDILTPSLTHSLTPPLWQSLTHSLRRWLTQSKWIIGWHLDTVRQKVKWLLFSFTASPADYTTQKHLQQKIETGWIYCRK